MQTRVTGGDEVPEPFPSLAFPFRRKYIDTGKRQWIKCLYVRNIDLSVQSPLLERERSTENTYERNDPNVMFGPLVQALYGTDLLRSLKTRMYIKRQCDRVGRSF